MSLPQYLVDKITDCSGESFADICRKTEKILEEEGMYITSKLRIRNEYNESLFVVMSVPKNSVRSKLLELISGRSAPKKTSKGFSDGVIKTFLSDTIEIPIHEAGINIWEAGIPYHL